MRRSASLTSLFAVGLLALTACSTSGDVAGSPSPETASVAPATPSGSAQAPAASTAPQSAATVTPSTQGTTPASSSATGLPAAVLQKAPGLAKKVEGWLTGWNNAGCEGLDLTGQGKARGCLNQAKGAAGVTQGVSSALEHAGTIPADAPLGQALGRAEALRQDWTSAQCMRDVRASDCVELATAFPQALRELQGALAAL